MAEMRSTSQERQALLKYVQENVGRSNYSPAVETIVTRLLESVKLHGPQHAHGITDDDEVVAHQLGIPRNEAYNALLALKRSRVVHEEKVRGSSYTDDSIYVLHLSRFALDAAGIPR